MIKPVSEADKRLISEIWRAGRDQFQLQLTRGVEELDALTAPDDTAALAEG